MPSLFFFFNDTATTEIYTLSLHDALPILVWLKPCESRSSPGFTPKTPLLTQRGFSDRKSTRLNSSHSQISYAVFCLKKKKKQQNGRAPATAHQTGIFACCYSTTPLISTDS